MKKEVGRHFQITKIHLIQPPIPYAQRLHLPVAGMFKIFEALPILN